MGRVMVILAAVVGAVASVTGGAQDGVSAHLAALGRVWTAVRYSHPRVALTGRDWDAVLDAALPAVKAAGDEKAFVDAVGAMLATLDDPVTRIEWTDHEPASDARPTPLPPAIRPIDGDGLLVDVRAPGALTDFAVMRKAITDNLDAIQKAGRVVVDIRGTEPRGFTGRQILGMLNDLLVAEPLPLPSERYIRHSGYKAQLGGAAFYTSDVITEAAAVQKPRAGNGPRRIAFVVDRASLAPSILLSMQARGLAGVIAVGGTPDTPVGMIRVPLSVNASAVVRVADLTLDGRRLELRPDVWLDQSEPDGRVYARALEAIASARRPAPGIDDPAPIWNADADYASQPYPSEPHRLLAVYRLWGVFDYFFPYKHLMERPWDEALATFIPRALAARDELEYVQAMSQMAALTNDSHVGVSGSRAMTKWMGETPAPVLVRYIEDKPIVTRVLDPAGAPGLAVGDEIVAVDGEDAAARANRLGQYIAYSTPAGRLRAIEARLLSGDSGSTGRLIVRSADGKSREVTVARQPRTTPATQREGDVVRLLDANIGYADLERLEVGDVGPMFDRFRDTAGIIFDMRGYPRGTAWAIAPRINTRKATAAAMFARPLLSAGSTRERLSFIQDLPPTTTWVYDRPTVMLIDERAISQAEHTGLFFKAANGTTFVGSPTTGANGDVTTLVLPGALRVSLTGHDVRWPDGRQLQRIGLVPDLAVTPTIAGVRQGRDEVLDRAVQYLKGNTSGSRPSR